MISKKCSICGKEGNSYVNGIPLCLSHEIKKYWKHSKGCLETHLDYFIERLEKRGKLDKDEITFLKEIKSQMPEIVDEFPVLFKKVK